MKHIHCVRCDGEQTVTMLNGEYKCGCGVVFSAAQVREALLQKRREAEKLAQINACGKCGKELADPGWCPWCGSKPCAPAEIIRGLNEQIRMIEETIAAGEPAEYVRARMGDESAVAHVFEHAVFYDARKPLIDLGPAAVPFLVGELGKDFHRAEVARRALFEIGDPRAVESLMEAFFAGYGSPDILKELTKQWRSCAARYFARLLNEIAGLSALAKQDAEKFDKNRRVRAIYDLLEFVLLHAAADVEDKDLIAASAMEDASVQGFTEDQTVVRMEEDAWGYLGYQHPREYRTETMDCSSLREAADAELSRRALLKNPAG